ncbi:MAG: serine hydrolase [Bacteroidota bacterium]
MKLKITILLLPILLPEQLVMGQATLRLVEERLLSFPNHAEIAIGIVDGDKTYKLGYRVIEGQSIAVNNASTLYEIGSISKTFVAALLINEIEKGTMSLGT